MSPEGSRVDEVSPDEALALLRAGPGTVLVDVRSRAEWSFVGLPDLSGLDAALWAIEWAAWPGMAPNPRFLDELMAHADGTPPERMLFICRSGARSMAAARAVAQAFAARGRPVHCTNVAEGFEGDLDPTGHRGGLNGWKARGLPWRQT